MQPSAVAFGEVSWEVVSNTRWCSVQKRTPCTAWQNVPKMEWVAGIRKVWARCDCKRNKHLLREPAGPLAFLKQEKWLFRSIHLNPKSKWSWLASTLFGYTPWPIVIYCCSVHIIIQLLFNLHYGSKACGVQDTSGAWELLQGGGVEYKSGCAW